MNTRIKVWCNSFDCCHCAPAVNGNTMGVCIQAENEAIDVCNGMCQDYESKEDAEYYKKLREEAKLFNEKLTKIINERRTK